MERIILIETSTALCSVALAEDGAVVGYRESSAPKAHASLTAVFIQEMLGERGLTMADCDAVCVSMGPGSYTGLRVGVSTAKGLCFGSGKPLLAVGTLDTLVAQAAAACHPDAPACHPDAAACHPDALACHPDTPACHPDAPACLPDAAACHPDAPACHPDTAAFHPDAPACHPDAAACHPDASACHPDAPACHPERSEGSFPCPPSGNYRYIIPMIDARRMEVYTAVFEAAGTPNAHPILPGASHVLPSKAEVIDEVAEADAKESPRYRQITETAPAIIDETSFSEYLEQGPCLFIGDGAGKCADVIRHPNATFCQCWPKASSMLEPAVAAFRAGNFQDVAYFEPFYLKEFVATVSKKKLW